MPTLVLHSVHEAAGAVFTRAGDSEISRHYGDPESEYCAVREGVGIADRSARGKLLVTGSDRARFLHGMVSNRVEGLGEGEGNYAALTDAQGHTLTDLWVHNRGDAFLLETEPGLQEKLYGSLDRYLIADDVKMEDVTASRAVLGLQGPGATELAAGVLEGFPGDLPEQHTAMCAFNGAEVAVTARTYTGEPGCDLWIGPEAAGALWKGLVEAGGRPVGFDALEVLRVEAGIARYGADIDERVMPLEAGLAHAVDFDKGCYIGQEAIAKMHFRGKPRRYLIGLQVESDTPPASGTPLLADDKAVGWVTSSVRSPTLGRVVALASIRRGFQEPGQAVSLEGETRAEVVALPFYGGVT